MTSLTRVEGAPLSAPVQTLDDPIALQIRAAAPQFAPFLPAGEDVEQIVAAVYLECQRVPLLLKCSPASLVSAATRLVQWGFQIGRTGYLVPFKGIATPVPGYKGLIEMVLASGAARKCEAREVYEGDLFEFEYGLNEKLVHIPGRRNARHRGAITHFYVIWTIRFGVKKFDVMSLDDVEDLRLKYSKQWDIEKWRRGECEAWYGIKSVIRKSAKQLPQNPKLSRFFAALQGDEVEELGHALLSAPVAEPADRPSAAGVVPAPAPEHSAPSGDSASEKQRELVLKLSKSHVWTETERAAIAKRLDRLSRADVGDMIDKMSETMDARKLKEREERDAAAAKPSFADPLAGGPEDELPF